MRRTVTTALAAGLALLLGIAAPAVAQTEGGAEGRTFTATTRADSVDATPGDGRCADSAGRCSLRAAVMEANALTGRTTIVLSRATYALTLTGASNDSAASGDLDVAGDVTIDGRGATINLSALGDRAFDVASRARVSIGATRVISGRPPAGESGGGFRSAGSLTLTGVTATNNVVQGEGASGGAVFNDGGVLDVTDTTLGSNRATRAGGGIEAVGGSTRLVLTTIEDNSAGPMPGNGGGLHLTGAGTVQVFYSRVLDNTAAAEGGGLWNSGSGTMTVGATTVQGNVANGTGADQGGGGLFNDGEGSSGGTLLVFQSRVLDNTATNGSGSGGGILNDEATLIVNDTDLVGNAAARAGGNIETNAGQVDVNRGLLWTGNAGPNPGNGGALHVSGPADVEIRNASLVANIAANEGGALWNSAVGSMLVADSVIVANVAHGDQADEGGGGIFNQSNEAGDGGGDLTVTGSTLWANTATNGSGSGGGILNERGVLDVTDTTLIGNQSARAGGGIEAVGGETALVGQTTLVDVRLVDNETGPMPGNGGGLHLTGAGTVVVDDSRVTGNVAANEGGGLWNSPSGQMTVTGTSIVANTVGVAGNGPNVYQEGPVAGGVLTVDGRVIAEGPNTLAFP